MRCKWIKMIMMAMGIFVLLTSCRLLPKEEEVTPVPSLSDAATSAQTEESPKTIGIFLPSNSVERWQQDGNWMKETLEADGFIVEVHYAGDQDNPGQAAQVETMISAGCDLLIIAAANDYDLDETLQTEKAIGIPVIAYDFLPMNVDAVNYYVAFGSRMIGTTQGNYIADQLGLKENEGPFNIEFFGGDPSDRSHEFFSFSALERLRPYLESGKLVCPSGQTGANQILTVGWRSDKAQARMEALIQSNQYAPKKTKLDAVYCANDSLAQGVTAALLDAGYTPENFPLITGQDCDIASVRNILAGTQSMSVFRDRAALRAQTVSMAAAILHGGEPQVNDKSTYMNGTEIIPTYLCDPVIVTKENYREILIDSGYYTEEEIFRE